MGGLGHSPTARSARGSPTASRRRACSAQKLRQAVLPRSNAVTAFCSELPNACIMHRGALLLEFDFPSRFRVRRSHPNQARGPPRLGPRYRNASNLGCTRRLHVPRMWRLDATHSPRAASRTSIAFASGTLRTRLPGHTGDNPVTFSRTVDFGTARDALAAMVEHQETRCVLVVTWLLSNDDLCIVAMPQWSRS